MDSAFVLKRPGDGQRPSAFNTKQRGGFSISWISLPHIGIVFMGRMGDGWALGGYASESLYLSLSLSRSLCVSWSAENINYLKTLASKMATKPRQLDKKIQSQDLLFT